MEKKHGKKYRGVKSLIQVDHEYTLTEAIDLLIQTSTTKFDAACEVHMNLAVDPKYADQMVRGTITLPHGLGKDVRVVAFVEEDKVKACLAAGAIKAGLDELMEEVSKGFTAFDMAVATPNVMKNLGKIAKVLGPKGLMPNVKTGTVTTDVVGAIGELKKGKVEFKTDKQGIMHGSFGKVSFGKEKMYDNAKALLRAVIEAKPSGVKGTYVKSIYLTTSMGPSIRISSKL